MCSLHKNVPIFEPLVIFLGNFLKENRKICGWKMKCNILKDEIRKKIRAYRFPLFDNFPYQQSY